MNRFLVSFIILFSFLTSQSFALVCSSSCLIHGEQTTHSDSAEDMPDCHSSQKQSSSKKQDSHSCSTSCQTDLLKSQYVKIEKVVIESGSSIKTFVHNSSDLKIVLNTSKESKKNFLIVPLRRTVPLFVLQQKYLI